MAGQESCWARTVACSPWAKVSRTSLNSPSLLVPTGVLRKESFIQQVTWFLLVSQGPEWQILQPRMHIPYDKVPFYFCTIFDPRHGVWLLAVKNMKEAGIYCCCFRKVGYLNSSRIWKASLAVIGRKLQNAELGKKATMRNLRCCWDDSKIFPHYLIVFIFHGDNSAFHHRMCLFTRNPGFHPYTPDKSKTNQHNNKTHKAAVLASLPFSEYFCAIRLSFGQPAHK